MTFIQPTMPIRQLTDADVEIYRALRLTCLRESPHAFTNSYEEFSQRTLESIAQQFRSHENFTLGAFEDDRLVGMVGFYRESALKLRHKGYIVSMYVLPEYRSHGIARALLQSDPDSYRLPLRQGGLLTRDPRMKERKKYGLKRARKAPQYTKR